MIGDGLAAARLLCAIEFALDANNQQPPVHPTEKLLSHDLRSSNIVLQNFEQFYPSIEHK